MAKSETLGCLLASTRDVGRASHTFMNATDADKKKIMIKFGLGPHEYNALLSGDLKKILDVLNEGVRAEAGRLRGPALLVRDPLRASRVVGRRRAGHSGAGARRRRRRWLASNEPTRFCTSSVIPLRRCGSSASIRTHGTWTPSTSRGGNVATRMRPSWRRSLCGFARAARSAWPSTVIPACSRQPHTKRSGARGAKDSRRGCFRPCRPRIASSRTSASTQELPVARVMMRPIFWSADVNSIRRRLRSCGKSRSSGASTTRPLVICRACRGSSSISSSFTRRITRSSVTRPRRIRSPSRSFTAFSSQSWQRSSCHDSPAATSPPGGPGARPTSRCSSRAFRPMRGRAAAGPLRNASGRRDVAFRLVELDRIHVCGFGPRARAR